VINKLIIIVIMVLTMLFYLIKSSGRKWKSVYLWESATLDLF
jgi:hypothetical protein